MILIGLRYFISIMGVVWLLVWNLVIIFSICVIVVFCFNVCLFVNWIMGLLVIGLENGMFSLIIFVSFFIN